LGASLTLRRIVVVSALAAGVLAGCAKPDTDKPPPTPQEAVAATSARTTAVGSARICRSIKWLDAAGNQVGSLMRSLHQLGTVVNVTEAGREQLRGRPR